MTSVPKNKSCRQISAFVDLDNMQTFPLKPDPQSHPKHLATKPVNFKVF